MDRLPVTVVTEALPSGTTTITTPANVPDIVVRVVNPLIAIGVRFTNVYLGSVVGLLSAALVDKTAVPAADFGALLWHCMGLGLAPAVLLGIKDLITVLGKLEGKYPLLTGGV